MLTWGDALQFPAVCFSLGSKNVAIHNIFHSSHLLSLFKDGTMYLSSSQFLSSVRTHTHGNCYGIAFWQNILLWHLIKCKPSATVIAMIWSHGIRYLLPRDRSWKSYLALLKIPTNLEGASEQSRTLAFQQVMLFFFWQIFKRSFLFVPLPNPHPSPPQICVQILQNAVSIVEREISQGTLKRMSWHQRLLQLFFFPSVQMET